MIAEEGEVEYFSHNPFADHGCSKYVLLNNLRITLERLFRTTNGNVIVCHPSHSGLIVLVEVLEQIFTQGLLPGYGWNQEINYPGFSTVLQWCLDQDSSADNASQRSTMLEIQQSLYKCSKSTETPEINIVVSILLNEVPLNAMMNLFKNFTPITGNYQTNSFMRDDVCFCGLVTCLSALYQKCPRTLSELPLPMLRHSFAVLFDVHEERIHVSSSFHSTKQLQDCITAPKVDLPDVVVCTKPSENSNLNYADIRAQPNKRDDDSIDLKDSDLTISPKNMSDHVEHDGSLADCSQEDAQLHLSELLITVIQGRNSGLSNPDLLECVEKIPNVSDPSGGILMEQASSSIKNYCESGIHGALDRSRSTDEESLSALDAGQLEWCIPSDDVPQSLLPIPNTTENAEDQDLYPEKLSAQFDLSPFMSTLQPPMSKKQALASQKYKCFGCGSCLHDSKGGFSRCELLKFYFCRDCHDNRTKRVLPANIFQNFNFKRCKVSKIGTILLDEIHCEPVFNLDKINPDVFGKSKQLSVCHDLRVRGSKLLKRLESCPLPWQHHDSVLMEKLNCVPLHILRSRPTIYSVCDMINVKSGLLCKQLNAFVSECQLHIESCNQCSGD